MAGDWLKIEAATPDKPEVLEIAQSLDMDSDLVFSKCFRVWVWFDQHSLDGTAPLTVEALLNRYSGVTGFVTAMEKVGWMERITDDGVDKLRLPNFADHNGQTAKKRAQTARRVSNHKKSNAKSNAPSVSKVTPTELVKALPREEKRREETKNPPILQARGGFDTIDEQQAAERELGNPLEAFAEAIGMSVETMAGVAETMNIKKDVLEAWAIDRAAESWRTPKNGPINYSTWFPDLQRYARHWNDNSRNGKGTPKKLTEKAEF